MSRSPITCHVLDASIGKPAAGVRVRLDVVGTEGNFQPATSTLLAEGVTNEDGRCTTLLDPDAKLDSGVYKMTFFTSDYFKATPHFYPLVEITFALGADAHYHIPLLMSPYSYTTYRGS